MKNILVILLNISLIILCCTKKASKVIVIQNGVKTYEYEYKIGGSKKDTIKEGFYKSYYHNGRLKTLAQYTDNCINGELLCYDSNGYLTQKQTWVNNRRWGYTTNYYANGSVKAESNVKDTLDVGLAKHYYINGSPEAFQVLDLTGRLLWDIKWDSLGNKLKDEGKVVASDIRIGSADSKELKNAGQCNCHSSSDSINIGNVSYISFTVACLPNTRQVISAKVFKEKKFLLEKICEVNLQYCYASFENTFNEKGKYQIRIIGELWDNKSNLIQKDSITKSVFAY